MPYCVSTTQLSESQEAYKPYSNALLCIHYMVKWKSRGLQALP